MTRENYERAVVLVKEFEEAVQDAMHPQGGDWQWAGSRREILLKHLREAE